jgi:hypothetical protein
MHLQRKGLVKQMLHVNSNHISFFGALLCFMYLKFLLWLGGSEIGSRPGLFGPLTGPEYKAVGMILAITFVP